VVIDEGWGKGGNFGCWILDFAPRCGPDAGRGRDTLSRGFLIIGECECKNVALLRSVSVNLAELRRAPASGGAPTAGGLWENIDQ